MFNSIIIYHQYTYLISQQYKKYSLYYGQQGYLNDYFVFFVQKSWSREILGYSNKIKNWQQLTALAKKPYIDFNVKEDGMNLLRDLHFLNYCDK